MADDELMARLRAADPCPDLPVLPPGRLDRLLENTMTTTDATTTIRRPRTLLLIAAALAVLAVGGGVLFSAGAGDGGTTTLTLAAGSGPAQDCIPVTADVLAGSDIAFAARVVDLSGGVVTLETTHRYTGDVGSTVQVTQGEDSAVDGAPIAFEDGQSYLLTADDGTIGSCGGSSLDTPELRAVFDAAFG